MRRYRSASSDHLFQYHIDTDGAPRPGHNGMRSDAARAAGGNALSALWAAGYLGVKAVCGAVPGAISVLLPLPLFMRKPCPPPAGSAIVAIDPALPVTNAGPLDVMIDCPLDNDDEPGNANDIGGAA
jgi:hypothetical protein